MAENIVINCTSNTRQNGVVISDETYWGSINGGSLSGLTQIIVNLYGASLVTPTYSYQLSSVEEATYIETGTVEISFAELAGSEYIDDGWWSIQITSNSDFYISNYSGFGIYASITFAVYSKINYLHVPEDIKYDAERYCLYVMWLEGLKFLDTTNVNSRQVKFTKRLLSLQKMLLNI